MKSYQPQYTVEDYVVFFKTVYGFTYHYDVASLAQAAFKEKLPINRSKDADMDLIYEWINLNHANGKIKQVNHKNTPSSAAEKRWTWVEEKNPQKNQAKQIRFLFYSLLAKLRIFKAKLARVLLNR